MDELSRHGQSLNRFVGRREEFICWRSVMAQTATLFVSHVRRSPGSYLQNSVPIAGFSQESGVFFLLDGSTFIAPTGTLRYFLSKAAARPRVREAASRPRPRPLAARLLTSCRRPLFGRLAGKATLVCHLGLCGQREPETMWPNKAPT